MNKNKIYYEEKALKSLCYLCGFNSDEWICDDKPDLQNNITKYGIEVVRDVHKEDIEKTNFLTTVWKKPYSEVDAKKIERFEKGQGRIFQKDGLINGATLGTKSSNPEHLIATIKNKVDLLNKSQYKKFEHYGLYVFVETTFIDSNFSGFVKRVISEVTDYQKDSPLKYDFLFLDQLYILCVCDLVNKEFNYIKISKDIRDTIDREIKSKWED